MDELNGSQLFPTFPMSTKAMDQTFNHKKDAVIFPSYYSYSDTTLGTAIGQQLVLIRTKFLNPISPISINIGNMDPPSPTIKDYTVSILTNMWTNASSNALQGFNGFITYVYRGTTRVVKTEPFAVGTTNGVSRVYQFDTPVLKPATGATTNTVLLTIGLANPQSTSQVRNIHFSVKTDWSTGSITATISMDTQTPYPTLISTEKSSIIAYSPGYSGSCWWNPGMWSINDDDGTVAGIPYITSNIIDKVVPEAVNRVYSAAKKLFVSR